MKIIALFAAALATPAVAADPQPHSQHEADKPEKTEKICRRIETTSSRIVRRECKTAEEWAAAVAEDGSHRLGVMSPMNTPSAPGLPR